LTETEQRAAGATHVALKRRKMRRPQRLEASRTEDLGAARPEASGQGDRLFHSA
jgi:hypothetical protein